jgi:hypothetical protein
MLKTITLTGADDTVQIHKLVTLSLEFPMVEWGILVSKSSSGFSRFPSADWLELFVETMVPRPSVKRSLHLCGNWLRRLITGDRSFIDEIGRHVWDCFPRVQLNFHGEDHKPCDEFYDILASFPDKEFIFQVDGNMGLKMMIDYFGYVEVGNASPLFDCSHGAGVLPNQWPDAYFMLNDQDHAKHGYAGGLGPDNVKEQLPRIESAAKGGDFWIDMETKLFTGFKANTAPAPMFDLLKCRSVLEQVHPVEV